ncbi:DUF6867 family protein [Frigidibacter sp. ROC022]|uniref:DUF6867 family protein n=1 Tax=Frigidibacter sp. ROC022 TaxID=2971796 RepID=UPI00215B57AF|nr:hypothetical protein [Frigidibacter sp. ROC022]MCR8725581.1 hypothetical protein [Frigidibacter sp. ROC022]
MSNLIWEEGLGAFLLVTIALGGGSAWMTGRAVAQGWDSIARLAIYIVLLSCAVRFIHFALFDGTLVSLHYYAVDFVILLAIGILARQFTRAGQMASQYGFAFRRIGPLGWGRKG